MPSKNSWTTAEQLVFLDEHYPEYEKIHSSSKPKYDTFWAQVQQLWFKSYPEFKVCFPSVASEEDLNLDQKEQLKIAVRKRVGQLRTWYRWRASTKAHIGGRQGRTKCVIVPFEESKDTRALNAVEMFSKTGNNYAEKIQPRTNQLIREMMDKNGGKLPPGGNLICVKRASKEIYEAQEDDVKGEILARMEEAAKLREEEKGASLKERTPKEYLKAIDKAGDVLTAYLQTLSEQTGWAYSVIFGGPQPNADGTITVASCHVGATPFGLNYGMTAKFNENCIETYGAFLDDVYPLSVRKARAIGTTDTPQTGNDNEAGLPRDTSSTPAPRSSSTPEPPSSSSPAPRSSSPAPATSEPRFYPPTPVAPTSANERSVESRADACNSDDRGVSASAMGSVNGLSSGSVSLQPLSQCDATPSNMPSQLDGFNIHGGGATQFASTSAGPYDIRGAGATQFGATSTVLYDVHSVGAIQLTLPSVVPPSVFAGNGATPSNQFPSWLSNEMMNTNMNTYPGTNFLGGVSQINGFITPFGATQATSAQFMPHPVDGIMPLTHGASTSAGHWDFNDNVNFMEMGNPQPANDMLDRFLARHQTPPSEGLQGQLVLPPVNNDGNGASSPASPASMPIQSTPLGDATLSEHSKNNLPEETGDTRRSSRAVVPSKRAEMLNMIGDNTRVHVPAGPGKENIPPSSPPAWFTLAKSHLLSRDLGDIWKECVEGWHHLEGKLGYNDAKTSLPATAARPDEWTRWVLKSRHGARRYDSIPFISDSAEIGIAIVKWWHAMQPNFRKSNNNMPAPVYTPADDSEWDSLRKSGPNGLVSVMTLVVWWGQALLDRTAYQLDSSDEWKNMVIDITKCMQAIATTTTTAQKRKATVGKENGSKRARVQRPSAV